MQSGRGQTDGWTDRLRCRLALLLFDGLHERRPRGEVPAEERQQIAEADPPRQRTALALVLVDHFLLGLLLLVLPLATTVSAILLGFTRHAIAALGFFDDGLPRSVPGPGGFLGSIGWEPRGPETMP